MIYDSYGILKDGSVVSKVYFLLLQKPRTVSDLSKEIYGGKVQLSNINRAIDQLVGSNYIEQVRKDRMEMRDTGDDLRKKYWKANFKPFMEFMQESLKNRASTQHSTKKELTESELKAVGLILDSKWFSRFFEKKHLECFRGEIDYAADGSLEYVAPIRYLAFLVEQLGAISNRLTSTLNESEICTIDEIIQSNDFDGLIALKTKKLNKKTVEKIEKIVSIATKNLGNYSRTRTEIDYSVNGFGILCIPPSLSLKLTSIGRIPLTVFLYFNQATERVSNLRK